jgi:hypothetical protein
MIGEVIQMPNGEGKPIFGILVDMDNELIKGGKIFIPCNELLWETKRRELHNKPLIPQKVEVKFIQE